jgi:cytochrome c-type biogenesis protein CcsB
MTLTLDGMFNLTLACYLAALLLAVANLFAKKKPLGVLVTILLSAGLVVQTAYIIRRWVEAQRPPFSNMFESLVLLAWTVVAVHLVLRLRRDVPLLAAASALLAVLTLAHASTYETAIKPLMPALHSNWLTVHVFTCFLGYGGFAVSFVASLCYLVSVYTGKSQPAELETFETVTAKTISFGFLFLTTGIITGAVWANVAWGTYWSWDPKETWSLITWFIYAVYLHCRFMRGWKGQRAAWVSVLGFASVLFTYFGVNFLMSGLHSYGKP